MEEIALAYGLDDLGVDAGRVGTSRTFRDEQPKSRLDLGLGDESRDQRPLLAELGGKGGERITGQGLGFVRRHRRSRIGPRSLREAVSVLIEEEGGDAASWP